MTGFVFYFFASVAVLSAVLCILQRNAVAAALWLVSTMFALAGIFVLLNAQFIAALQVLVYAGAVMVLFLFVIMLLNLGREKFDLRGPASIGAAVVLVGLLAAELFTLGGYSAEKLAQEVAQAPHLADPALAFPGLAAVSTTAEPNVILDLARPLFSTYLVPFEITSVLLLAAIVGAVVLAKRQV